MDSLPPTRQKTESVLLERLLKTRAYSLELAAPLSAEDQTVQPNDDASPTKWHLAHVTWFFETFLLKPFCPGYRLFDERFPFCFNSYYEAEGARQPRGSRGLLTRPTTTEVLAYRAHVDDALRRFVGGAAISDTVADLIEVGINHEQQHQELLLTDILSLFAASPLRPAYRPAPATRMASDAAPLTFTSFEGGLYHIGHDGAGFGFDNEGPRHRAFLHPFQVANRLVTSSEWLEFIEAGGYRDPSLWLADGWATVKTQGWAAPLYWEWRDGSWHHMTLSGLHPIDPAAPVSHVSYYEADAYARFAGKRLPTEFEWEFAARELGASAPTEQTDPLTPRVSDEGQMFGVVWQWTQSAYLPYPGYRAAPGAIGEYNGKFMCGQHVLRGSSCATPAGHARLTYRNFFYPHQRWQFTGLRLASDA
ncbi:MAG: ergothioneine biosynthesis protein EgtB [Beijerinckiaceae bacterium]|nr:ergothioneine biosynthesis protein EgtB [Beijerinckiaceae bacterium]